MRKNFILIVALCSGLSSGLAQSMNNAFRFEPKETNEEYQKYVGQTVRFREAIGEAEKYIKVKAKSDIDYIISSIDSKPITEKNDSSNVEVTIEFSEVDGKRNISLTVYNKFTEEHKNQIGLIPLYFVNEMNAFSKEYAGKEFTNPTDDTKYSIIESVIAGVQNKYGYTIASTRFRVKNMYDGQTYYISSLHVLNVLAGNVENTLPSGLLDHRVVPKEITRLNSATNRKDLAAWANAITKLGYSDDANSIVYQVVIPGGQGYNVPSAVAYANTWFLESKYRHITKKVDYKEKVLTLKGTVMLDFIASTTCGLTYKKLLPVKENVQAWANVIIEFKEDRMRITFEVPRYDVTYYVPNDADLVPDSFKKHSSLIKNEPPFSYDTNKNNWLEAYINANSQCLTTMNNLVSYMNKTNEEQLLKKAKDEARQNEDW